MTSWPATHPQSPKRVTALLLCLYLSSLHEAIVDTVHLTYLVASSALEGPHRNAPALLHVDMEAAMTAPIHPNNRRL